MFPAAPILSAEIGSLAEVCDEGTQVIALGDINDVELYRNLIRHGVQDYLVKPVSAETVAAALSRAERGPNGEAAPKIGRLIAVIGARGGVGATTVATNVAWTLAHDHEMRVALVDLDLFFGTCGLALDLELGRGFREALENPARVDSLFIERAMVREGENLFVLSTEEALDGAFSFDPSALTSLIERLRRDFQCVVLDFPRFAARRQAPRPDAARGHHDGFGRLSRRHARYAAPIGVAEKHGAESRDHGGVEPRRRQPGGRAGPAGIREGRRDQGRSDHPDRHQGIRRECGGGQAGGEGRRSRQGDGRSARAGRRFAYGRVRSSKLAGWRSMLKGAR